MSLWPFKYLVVLCSDEVGAQRAAAAGSTGLMNVLSTATRMPRPCARRQSASMSHSVSTGFVGVSSSSSRVFGRMRLLDHVQLGGVDEIELEAEALPHLVGQPERAAVDVVGHDDVVARGQESPSRVPIAASPDAKAKACLPPSSAARLRSSACRVGILRPRVLVALVTPEPVLHVGGGLVDGRHDRRRWKDRAFARRGWRRC